MGDFCYYDVAYLQVVPFHVPVEHSHCPVVVFNLLRDVPHVHVPIPEVLIVYVPPVLVHADAIADCCPWPSRAATHVAIAAGFGVLVVSPFTDMHVTIWERHAFMAMLAFCS